LNRTKFIKKDIKAILKKVNMILERGGEEENIPTNHLINGRNVMLMPLPILSRFAGDAIHKRGTSRGPLFCECKVYQASS